MSELLNTSVTLLDGKVLDRRKCTKFINQKLVNITSFERNSFFYCINNFNPIF